MSDAPAKMRQVVLRKRAQGKPTVDNFEVVEADVPRPAEGEVLVRTLVLSVDPYMRGRIGGDAGRSSSQPLDEGAVIVGATVGEVVESRSDAYQKGDIVHAYSGWREYYTKPAGDVERVHTEFGQPLEKFVGVLGMTGLTSYYGLVYVGQPKAGETVVVSGAAGAVGSVVVQVAKILGCRVVGLAGSPAKCEYLRELGADVAINYKTEDVPSALDAAAPDGVDVYYDNTGGVITDAVLPRINRRARIVVCGQISDYNAEDGKPSLGPRLLHHLLWKSARMEGFLVQDFEEKDQETYARLAGWMNEGRLTSREDAVRGLDQAPAAFVRLFDGANFGKQVVLVADRSAASIEAEKARAK
jgi:NADPH-dependent curcumin reductase CurA